MNTFSLKEYNEAIEAGHMSIMGKCVMSKRDLARYYFLLHLYQLRLDKNDFKKQFGCSIERLLPAEMAFYRAHRAFATDNRDELTLTTMGRYLTLILYRQFLSGMNNLRDQARDALDGEEHNLLFGDETNCAPAWNSLGFATFLMGGIAQDAAFFRAEAPVLRRIPCGPTWEMHQIVESVPLRRAERRSYTRKPRYLFRAR